jgi:hypothetical protein
MLSKYGLTYSSNTVGDSLKNINALFAEAD